MALDPVKAELLKHPFAGTKVWNALDKLGYNDDPNWFASIRPEEFVKLKGFGRRSFRLLTDTLEKLRYIKRNQWHICNWAQYKTPGKK